MPSKREAFHSERQVYELGKKMPFCFKVIKTFIKQGNEVIEMIKGACTSKKCNFLDKLEFL